MNISARIRGTGYAGGDGVADSINESAIALGQFHCRQSVSGLTTLRNGYDHIIGGDYRIAITELTGILHFHGYAAVALYELLAYQASVPRSPASHDNETLGVHQPVTIIRDGTQDHIHAIGRRNHPASHAVCKTFRLLKYLLEHEVGKTTFLYLA